MADYVALSNESVNPNSPLISATMYALRDNPVAIAEGASGAPRIQKPAMANGSIDVTKITAPTSGNALSAFVIRPGTAPSNDDASFITLASGAFLRAGSCKLEFDYISDPGGATCEFRVLLGGVEIDSFSTTAGSYLTRSVELNFNARQSLVIQGLSNSAGSTARIRSAELKTNVPTLAFFQAF